MMRAQDIGRRRSMLGMTLPELAAALAIASVVVLAGGVTMEMTQRETYTSLARTESSHTVFGVLHCIEADVMRAQTIEVPDPDYPNHDSIQLRVPLSSGIVRRAFRREGTTLVIDCKDEADSPRTVFEGISSLSFTALDAPTNSLIEIACTTTNKGQDVHMRTVARKRN